jgi:hypothetical protein
VRRPRAAAACVVAALAVLAVASGCGGGGSFASPGDVVDSWSQAITSGDADAAGELFADGATVIQDGRQKTLADRAEAVAWNAALPCGWKIVTKTVDGEDVRGTFALTRRPGAMCDDPRSSRSAAITVRDGKIAFFHELPSDAQPA